MRSRDLPDAVFSIHKEIARRVHDLATISPVMLVIYDRVYVYVNSKYDPRSDPF